MSRIGELLVKRPHANIITTFINTQRVDQELITTTCAMPGLFNGQTVIGNTSKQKLFSAPRGLLNRMKHSGMRIWAETDGVYRLLTMPAAFETGLNYCRWIYLAGGDTITVETFAAVHSTDIVTQLSCTSPRRFIVSCQLVMGTHEYQQDMAMECRPGCAAVRPAPGSAIAAAYPELCYELHFPEDAIVSDDRIFFEDSKPQDATLLTLQLAERKRFSLRIHGTLECANAKPCPGGLELTREQAESVRCYTDLMRGFALEEAGEAYRATEYLISLGHRRIGFIYDPLTDHLTPNRLRFMGYRRALEEHGIPFDPLLVAENTDAPFHSGYITGFNAIKSLYQRAPDITAVFAFSDVLALGAAKGAFSMGLHVPEDLSIVGFDGIEAGEFYNPSLDTIYQPANEMALASIEFLFDMLQGGKAQHRIYDGVMLKRGSCQRRLGG